MTPFTVSGLTQVINQLLPEPHAGLLAGLLFGTKAAISREFYDALVASGTLHIIALSGENITIMEGLIGMILLPLVGKRWAAFCTIGLIVWFVWFVGPSSSIIRAAIMGSLSLVAVLFGRQYWAILSWIITVGIMLIIHAAWLFDISFQLSAMATLGIILFGSHTKGGSLWELIRADLHLTLAAQVFTIPLVLFTFHRFSLIAPLANLAIGWAIPIITMLGWVTVLVGFVLLYVGQVIAWFDWIFLEYIIRTIYFMSRVPFASFGW